MKISITILFLSLMVRDVLSVRGLHTAEVSIISGGQVPSASEDEVTCTISTIEPANSDSMFVKYIASREEAVSQYCGWRYVSVAEYFETCADVAANSNSKMFMFDNGRCLTSDGIFNETDQCSKDHYQMVYMDAEAVPEARELVPDNRTIFCNIDWTVECKDGNLVNDLTKNFETCSDKIDVIKTYDDPALYYLLIPSYKVAAKDHQAECANNGAMPCAPSDDGSISTFIDHLQVLFSINWEYFIVGLNSSEQMNFQWASGVAMPNSHEKWRDGALSNPNSHGCIKFSGVLEPTSCDDTYKICCMVPYFSD